MSFDYQILPAFAELKRLKISNICLGLDFI